MTEKKEKILQSALQLFGESGYHATSTSKIAKDANVSEALIFRHFLSKEGLMEAVLKEGEAKVKLIFSDIIVEEDPRKLIRKTLEMPFDKSEEDYEFWRLQFKLKWELGGYSNDKMKPLETALKKAFEKLKYSEPALEAEYLIHLLDGLVGAILRGQMSNQTKMKNFLLKKYKLG